MAASASTNAPNLNAALHAVFWCWQRDAKRLNLLARTSNVAIGLLRVRGACKRERGDGGWKKAVCCHLTSSLPSASNGERSSVGASQP
jgi:hypothetical protein